MTLRVFSAAQAEAPAEVHSALLSAAWLSPPPRGRGAGPPGPQDPKVLASHSPLPCTSHPPLHFSASSGVSAGPSPPSTAASDKSKKSSGGIASALGLKKFFSVLSQGTRPKMAKSRSYSVEQLQPPAPGPASHTDTPKVKRAPSLQSLHLVSTKGPAEGYVRAGGW